MSTGQVSNGVRELRTARGWSQAELAKRAGISRAAVSAIEINRLVPSVSTGLALARTFGCTVEDLFDPKPEQARQPAWAWPAAHDPCRYWHAQLGGRTLLYPVEPSAAGEIAHDGVVRDGIFDENRAAEPEKTLVMACCDPAAGLLAAAYAQSTGFRLIVLPRSSQQALALLKEKVVHVAGIHLAAAGESEGNARSVVEQVGTGFSLLRVAAWEEGLAISSRSSLRSVSSTLRSKLTWVGRESGSGARQCLDELLSRRPAPRRVARDHRGVAEAVRCGWADVGVCLRLVSDEANLRFLSLRWESYDLCFPSELEDDPRMRGLVATVCAPAYRRLLGALPGYDVRAAGSRLRV